MKQAEASRRYKLFGHFIRVGRLKTGLYQKDVAAMLGLSQAYYSQIEAGTRQVNLTMAMDICTVLKLDLNDFLLMNRPNRRQEKPHTE